MNESSNPSDHDYAQLFERSLAKIRELKARVEQLEAQAVDEAVAVIGVGCRLPGEVDSLESLWALLTSGRQAITAAPSDRWTRRDIPFQQALGGFIDDVWSFDASFFKISPREAECTDPQQRLLLETAWEALERSACRPSTLLGSPTGVFVGMSSNDFRLHLESRGTAAVDAYSATGNFPAFGAGRIAYTLGLRGPCMTVDTACSSSLAAVHLAAAALRARECSLAIAGGVNLMLSEITAHMLARVGALSPDGVCRTFDANANGFVRGEGAAVVVLKRLSDALADGDPVRGVLLSTVVNQDGRSTGLTAPNGQSQQAMLRDALARSGIAPAEVGYVEAHGTGTTLGDPIEVEALQAVLGNPRPDGSRCWIGSVKPNVGHLEAAAGIAGLLKVLACLEYEKIPPQVNFSVLNPKISLAGSCLDIPRDEIAWPRPVDGRRVAGVSSFGLSGTNVHALVADPPMQCRLAVEEATAADPSLLLWLPLSAQTPGALRAMASAYADRFVNATDHELPDLCWAAGMTRDAFDVRVALRGRHREDFIVSLRSIASGESPVPQATGQRGARAMVFTGQGAQYWKMGRGLLGRFEAFREALARCDAAMEKTSRGGISDVVFGVDDGRLNQTTWTQPALFAIEYGLYAVWSSLGVEPDVVLGHSLGEYVAACVAGVFSLEDALQLVSARGRLMQSLSESGAMVSASMPEVDALALVQGQESRLAIAAFNAPGRVVFSGASDAVDRVVRTLLERGVEHRRLVVSHAFHSPLMSSMLPDFERVLAATPMHPPRLPLVANISGARADASFSSPEGFLRHIVEPVDFVSSVLHAANELGVREWIEIGPHPTLSSLIAETLSDGHEQHAIVPSLRRGRDDVESMFDALTAVYLRGHVPCVDALAPPIHRRKVALPTYPFQRTLHRYTGGDMAETVTTRWSPLKEFDALGTGRKSPRRWLVLCDRMGVGQLVRDRLERDGSECTVIHRDARQGWTDALSRVGEGIFSGVDGVLDCSPLDVVDAVDDPSTAVYRSCEASLAFVRAWLSAPKRCSSLSWWVLDAGAGTEHKDERRSLGAVAAASVRGVLRVIGRECSSVRSGHVELLDVSVPSLDAVARLLPHSQEDRLRVAHGRVEASRWVPLALSSTAWTLRSDRPYLITGAHGGIGGALAQALVEGGARQLVLVGRRREDELGEPQRRALETLRSRCEVETWALDVADRAALEHAMTQLRENGKRLAGVFHLAGALHDAPLLEQDMQTFSAATRAKVDGAYNLHALCGEVDVFCLFSSISSAFGLVGQANYAAANAALDALAEYRRRIGQNALSVQWGPWDEAGMAHTLGEAGRRNFRAQGVDYLPPASALQILSALLAHQDAPAVVSALSVRWSTFAEALAPGRRIESMALLRGSTIEMTDEPQTVEPTLRRHLASTEPRRRLQQCERFVADEIRRILKLAPTYELPFEMPLRDLGMDSLMLVELRNVLVGATGVSFAASELFNYPTVRRLAAFVIERVQLELLPDIHDDQRLLAELRAELSSVSTIASGEGAR